MRTTSLLLLTLLAACGGTPPARRDPPVPLGPTDMAPPPAVKPEPRTRTESDKSPPAPQPETPPGDAGVSVTYRTVTQIVEKPVEVQRAEAPASRYDPYYGYQYDPYAYPYDRRYPSRHCEQPWLPINTIAGAGIGALIGDANGSASDGAWIGAGVGLLLDLGNLCW